MSTNGSRPKRVVITGFGSLSPNGLGNTAFCRCSGERLFTKAVAAEAIVLDDRWAEMTVPAISARTHPAAICVE